QLNVAEGDVEGALGCEREGLLGAGAGGDGEALPGQVFAEGVSNQRLVIDDEEVYGLGAGRHGFLGGPGAARALSPRGRRSATPGRRAVHSRPLRPRPRPADGPGRWFPAPGPRRTPPSRRGRPAACASRTAPG